MPIGLTQTPTMGRWQAGKFLAGTLTIPHEAPSISGRCLLQPDRHGILYRYSVCRKATLYPPTLFVTVASLGDSRVSLILSVATSPSFRRCYSHNESNLHVSLSKTLHTRASRPFEPRTSRGQGGEPPCGCRAEP
jgi:hypothetical protein